jgi:methyl-accepting chemotaxis protein
MSQSSRRRRGLDIVAAMVVFLGGAEMLSRVTEANDAADAAASAAEEASSKADEVDGKVDDLGSRVDDLEANTGQ